MPPDRVGGPAQQPPADRRADDPDAPPRTARELLRPTGPVDQALDDSAVLINRYTSFHTQGLAPRLPAGALRGPLAAAERRAGDWRLGPSVQADAAATVVADVTLTTAIDSLALAAGFPGHGMLLEPRSAPSVAVTAAASLMRFGTRRSIGPGSEWARLARGDAPMHRAAPEALAFVQGGVPSLLSVTMGFGGGASLALKTAASEMGTAVVRTDPDMARNAMRLSSVTELGTYVIAAGEVVWIVATGAPVFGAGPTLWAFLAAVTPEIGVGRDLVHVNPAFSREQRLRHAVDDRKGVQPWAHRAAGLMPWLRGPLATSMVLSSHTAGESEDVSTYRAAYAGAAGHTPAGFERLLAATAPLRHAREQAHAVAFELPALAAALRKHSDTMWHSDWPGIPAEGASHDELLAWAREARTCQAVPRHTALAPAVLFDLAMGMSEEDNPREVPWKQRIRATLPVGHAHAGKLMEAARKDALVRRHPARETAENPMLTRLAALRDAAAGGEAPEDWLPQLIHTLGVMSGVEPDTRGRLRRAVDTGMRWLSGPPEEPRPDDVDPELALRLLRKLTSSHEVRGGEEYNSKTALRKRCSELLERLRDDTDAGEVRNDIETLLREAAEHLVPGEAPDVAATCLKRIHASCEALVAKRMPPIFPAGSPYAQRVTREARAHALAATRAVADIAEDMGPESALEAYAPELWARHVAELRAATDDAPEPVTLHDVALHLRRKPPTQQDIQDLARLCEAATAWLLTDDPLLSRATRGRFTAAAADLSGLADHMGMMDRGLTSDDVAALSDPSRICTPAERLAHGHGPQIISSAYGGALLVRWAEDHAAPGVAGDVGGQRLDAVSSLAQSLPLPNTTLHHRAWDLDITEGPDGYGIDTAGNSHAARAEAGGYVALELLQNRLSRLPPDDRAGRRRVLQCTFGPPEVLRLGDWKEAAQDIWTRWLNATTEELADDGSSITDSELCVILGSWLQGYDEDARGALKRQVMQDITFLAGKVQAARGRSQASGQHLVRLGEAMHDDVDSLEKLRRRGVRAGENAQLLMASNGHATGSDRIHADEHARILAHFSQPVLCQALGRGRGEPITAETLLAHRRRSGAAEAQIAELARRGLARAKLRPFIDLVIPPNGPGPALTMLSRAVAENPTDASRELLDVAASCGRPEDEDLTTMARTYAGLLGPYRPSGHGALVMAHQIARLLP